MQQVANAAQRYGRKMCFVGSSMVDNAKMARKLGYLDIPDNLLVTIDQALNLPEKQVVIMCTGSQGEPSSILGRLSTGRYRQFDIQSGDTVVLSSHPIPGNEENVYRTINRLFQRGANVLYEGIAAVHVSGHASQEEMKLMINLVRPKFFIPIHGELRQLKQHALLGTQLGIPSENIRVVENGQVIELSEAGLRLAERVPGGYVFVDGSGVGDVTPALMRERESLANDGVMFVHLVLDARSGRLLDAPEIVTRGFMLNADLEDLLEQARQRVEQVVESANGSLEKDVEKAVRTFFYNELQRAPMIFVSASRV